MVKFLKSFFGFSSAQAPSKEEPTQEENVDSPPDTGLQENPSSESSNINEESLPNYTENTRKAIESAKYVTGITKSSTNNDQVNSQSQIDGHSKLPENNSPENGINFTFSHYTDSNENDIQTHTENQSTSNSSVQSASNTQKQIDLDKQQLQQQNLSVSEPNFSVFEPRKVYTNPAIDQLNSKKVRLQLNFSCDFDPNDIMLVKIDKETNTIISKYKLVEMKTNVKQNYEKMNQNVEPFDKKIEANLNVEKVSKISSEILKPISSKSESEIKNLFIVNHDIFRDNDFSDMNVSNGETFDFMNDQKVQNAKGLPEYNILLLGETGAGKSTTVNAFANYMKYTSFEEAKMGDFVELIPSKFTLPHPKTGKPYEIKSSQWENNERPDEDDDGGSSTQSPLGYKFIDRNRLIRIIDTPGMGDTRGTEVDKENFEQILSYLNHHQQLHGIVILIKSSETRTTASFRYCITELLAYLHKSACRNIVFCFTFSRNSLYGPGDGFQTLKDFLKTESHKFNLNVQIKVNCFFIDNEAYRFLVAKKQNYPFTEAMEKMYQESWCNSAQNTQSLINRIIQLDPHNLTKTTSLHQARKLIMELAEPMVELEKIIRHNIETIETHKKDLSSSRMTRQKAQSNLQIEVEFVEARKLDLPKTVCTAAKCVRKVNLKNGMQKTVYKLTCHENCRLKDEKIRYCNIMKKSGNDRICSICGCKWNEHKNITMEYVVTKRSIQNEQEQYKIQQIDYSIDKIQNSISAFTQLVKEYQHELNVIQDVAAKFDYILIVYSNSARSKFIETYLDNLLTEERKMSFQVGNYSSSVSELLNQMKVDHKRRVSSLSQSKSAVNLEQIPQLCNRLFVLKHTGPQFQQMIQSVKEGKREEFKYFDKIGVDLSVRQ